MSVTHLKNLLNEPVPDLQRLHCSIPKFIKYTKLTRQLLKVLVKVWSEDEDSRRILALLGLLKLVQCSPNNIAICIKSMFIAFVRNSKFVMGSTLAHINFTRHSLIELFSLNLDEAYMHAFVYIRQLAIVLRKAYVQHSLDNSKAVQNWQFINSLRLWCDLVARHADSHQLLGSLLHPLVQILVGTIRLNPGERWIPLRFHCVSMLHTLAGVPILTTDQSKEAGDNSQSAPQSTKLIGRSRPRLVPSLPLLLDVFQLVNFNKHSSAPSTAPLDLRLLLHFSPSQRRETASMDAIVSWLVDLLAESAALGAVSVAFPEFAMPLINQLKQFSRTCRVAAFTRQTKALQVKLREHSDWIGSQRRRLRSLANPDEIALLESQLGSYAGVSSEDHAKASPFWSFYIRHKEVRANELSQLTLSHQKDSSRVATIAEKLDHQRASKKRIMTEDNEDSDEDSDESDSSDGSYDYDDGIQVTHVSRRHKSSRQGEVGANAPASGSDSDSDFDLEAALKENEEEGSDDEGTTTAADEVTDFEMSDSDPDLDSPMSEREGDEVEESESLGPGASKAFKAKKTKAGKRGGGKGAHQTRKRAGSRGGAGSKFTKKKKAVSHGRGGRR